MTYFDGFVIAVEHARKQEFIDHAQRTDRFFREHGATRVVEGWGDDLPEGKVTDFRRSVQAKEGEGVVFSWIEWPDKATRDAAMKAMEGDAAMMAEPMPFDGSRMIFGGFTPLIDERKGQGARYLDGFVEAWGDDVPDGKKTDFKRAVQAKPGERVVFSFIEWPDKATRDGAWPEMMKDERMQPDPSHQPFDDKRMFWAGFAQVVELV